MKRILLATLLAMAVGAALGAQQPPSSSSQAPLPVMRPLHVYIRAGLKTHGPGQHDYPQYLADWSKTLTERGAVVDGSLHFPTADELVGVDVMIMYKGDGGNMTLGQKAVLEAYLLGGGGLVSLHDTLCGDEPAWFSTIVGGAKLHGEVNFSAGAIKYTIVDKESPIMKGLSDFEIQDEAFFKMTWAKNAQGQPAIHVLATAPMPSSGEVVPQTWTYERTMFGGSGVAGQPYRAFVWMQGHNYVNFTNPNVEPMLLRGIAWAAKYPVDALMTVRPARGGGAEGNPAGGQGRGGPGGRGRGNTPTGSQ